jgi:hypothetical protein
MNISMQILNATLDLRKNESNASTGQQEKNKRMEFATCCLFVGNKYVYRKVSNKERKLNYTA